MSREEDPQEEPQGPKLRPPGPEAAYALDDLRPAAQGLWRGPPPDPALQPLISIAVLTLDGDELVDRLLQSFEATNRYPNFEIIVADHGSSDKTLKVLRRWAARLPVRI